MKKTKKQSNGLYEGWYSNGVKAYSINYKAGKRDGLSEAWYSNGVKAYSINYKDGKKHGLAERWYGSRAMVPRGVYDNDKLVKRLSPDISLQEAIDNGEIADLSLELQDLIKLAANGCIKKEGKMKEIYFDGKMYSPKDLVNVMTDEKIDDGQYSSQTVLDMRDVIIELLEDLQRTKNI